jgi:hypothetical protein
MVPLIAHYKSELPAWLDIHLMMLLVRIKNKQDAFTSKRSGVEKPKFETDMMSMPSSLRGFKLCLHRMTMDPFIWCKWVWRDCIQGAFAETIFSVDCDEQPNIATIIW